MKCGDREMITQALHRGTSKDTTHQGKSLCTERIKTEDSFVCLPVFKSSKRDSRPTIHVKTD